MSPAKSQKRRDRHNELRKQLWPEVDDGQLWKKDSAVGFTNIPRTLPIMMSIMDDMANGRPISAVFLELWCRTFDESLINLSQATDLAFHSGFSGQRAVRTWRERMHRLAELGFVLTKPGPAGDLGYALIVNPYLVIREAFEKGGEGVRADKYHALLARAAEIGATDLN